MRKNAKVWTIRAVDLRRMASRAQEPERQRKLLTLAEQYEERDDRHAPRGDVGKDIESE